MRSKRLRNSPPRPSSPLTLCSRSFFSRDQEATLRSYENALSVPYKRAHVSDGWKKDLNLPLSSLSESTDNKLNQTNISRHASDEYIKVHIFELRRMIEDMVDHRSCAHNKSSLKIKA